MDSSDFLQLPREKRFTQREYPSDSPDFFIKGLSSLQEMVEQNVQAYEVWNYDTTKLVVHIKKDSKAWQEYFKWKGVLDPILERLDHAQCQIISMLEAIKKEGKVLFNARFPLEIILAIQDYVILLRNQLGRPITERYDESISRILLDYLAEYLCIFADPVKILEAYGKILKPKNPEGTEILSEGYQILERILRNPALQLKFQTGTQHSKTHILQTLNQGLWELKLSMLTHFLVQIKKNHWDTDDITVFYELDPSSAIDQNLMDVVHRMSDLMVSGEELGEILDYLNFFYRNNLKLSTGLNLASTLERLQKYNEKSQKGRFSVIFHEACRDFIKIYGTETKKDPRASLNFADKFMIVYEDLFDPEIVEDRILLARDTIKMLKGKIGDLFLLFLGEEEEERPELEILLEKLREGDLERLSNRELWLLNGILHHSGSNDRKYKHNQGFKRWYYRYAHATVNGVSKEIIKGRTALLAILVEIRPRIIELVEDELLYQTIIRAAERTDMMVTPRQVCRGLGKIFHIELDWIFNDQELEELLGGKFVHRQGLKGKRSDTQHPRYPLHLEQAIRESLNYDLLKLVPVHKFDVPFITVKELIHFYKRLNGIDKIVANYYQEIERLAISAKNLTETIRYVELRLGEETIVRYLGPVTIIQNLSSARELINQNLVPLEVHILSTSQNLDEIRRFLIPDFGNKTASHQVWNLVEIEKGHHRYFVRADLKHEEENDQDGLYMGRKPGIGSVMRQVIDALLTQQRIYQLTREGVEDILILIPGLGFQSVPLYQVPGWKTLAIKTTAYPFGAFPTGQYSQWLEVLLLKLENLRLLYKLIPKGRKVFICYDLGVIIGFLALRSLQSQSSHLRSPDPGGFPANGFICLDCPGVPATWLEDLAPRVEILIPSGIGLSLNKTFPELTQEMARTGEKEFTEVSVLPNEPAEKKLPVLASPPSPVTVHRFPKTHQDGETIQPTTGGEGLRVETLCSAARSEDLIPIVPDEQTVRKVYHPEEFPEPESPIDGDGEIKQEFLKGAIAVIPTRLEEEHFELLFHEICVYSKSEEYKTALKTRLGELANSSEPSEKIKAKKFLMAFLNRGCPPAYREILNKKLETFLDPGSTKIREAVLKEILEVLTHHFIGDGFTAQDFILFLGILQKTQLPTPAVKPVETELDDRGRFLDLLAKATFIRDKIVEPRSKAILDETFALISPFSKLLISNSDLARSKDFSYAITVLISGIVFAMSAYNLKDMTLFRALKPELMSFKKYNDPKLNYLFEAYRILLEYHKILRRIAHLDSTLTLEEATLEGIDAEILELLTLEDKELAETISELKEKAQAIISSGFSENSEELERMIDRVATPGSSKRWVARNKGEEGKEEKLDFLDQPVNKSDTGLDDLEADREKLKQMGWKIAIEIKEQEKKLENLLSKTRALILDREANEKFKKLEKVAQDLLDLRLIDLELMLPHSPNTQELEKVFKRKSENLGTLIEELREEQDRVNSLIGRMKNCPVTIKIWFKSNAYSKFSQLLDFFGRTLSKVNVITKSTLPEWTFEYQALLGQLGALKASKEKNALLYQMLLIEAKLRILENKFLETEQVKTLLHIVHFMGIRLEMEQIAILRDRVQELSKNLISQLSRVRSYYYQLRDYHYAHPEEIVAEAMHEALLQVG
jgi:hypothetical protein